MNLLELIDSTRTDKNTTHSYLNLYQDILVGKKDTALNVLEVGIDRGGSIKLWSEFFTNSIVYGLDIMDIKDVYDELKNNDKIKLYTSIDAYDEKFVKNTFLDNNITFDFMLDDGPHTLESMKQFIYLYSKLMTKDGILIIEDVQDWSWIEILTEQVSNELKPFIKIYDLREIKGRYDDIVFIIDKYNISI